MPGGPRPGISPLQILPAFGMMTRMPKPTAPLGTVFYGKRSSRDPPPRDALHEDLGDMKRKKRRLAHLVVVSFFLVPPCLPPFFSMAATAANDGYIPGSPPSAKRNPGEVAPSAGTESSPRSPFVSADSSSTPAVAVYPAGALRVFHRPGCEHSRCANCTAAYLSREDAVKAGYKPCGICKP